MKLSLSHLAIGLLVLLSYNVHSIAGENNKKETSRSVAQEAKVLIEDIVHRIEKEDTGFRVMFRVHSGIYRLKDNSRHFDSIAKALKDSQENGDTIELKADATSLEIEELILKTK